MDPDDTSLLKLQFLVILKHLFCIYCGDVSKSKERFPRVKMFCKYCSAMACMHHHSDFQPELDTIDWPTWYRGVEIVPSQLRGVCKPCKSCSPSFDRTEVIFFLRKYLY